MFFLSSHKQKETTPRRRSRTPSALALHGFEVRAPYRRGSSWPTVLVCKKRACGTTDSHVVPHRSTEVACSGLTSQIGRDTVRFTEYGRRRPKRPTFETKRLENPVDSRVAAGVGDRAALELSHAEGSGGGRGATVYSYCLLCLGHYSPLAWQQQLSRLEKFAEE